MVSSKCFRTVSPSPFRSLAALMPPWAQTECERLTGTIEKRSTVPPASAILMTAASPASPPPTTIILGVAAISYLGRKRTSKIRNAENATKRRNGSRKLLLQRHTACWWIGGQNIGCDGVMRDDRVN